MGNRVPALLSRPQGHPGRLRIIALGVQHPKTAREQDWEAAWQEQAPSRGALAAGRGAERTAPCEGGASWLKGSEAA